MAQTLENRSSISPATQRTTVEFHNRLPFAVKILRKTEDGQNVCVNVLPAYRHYVQEAAVGETFSVRLDVNGWAVARVRATQKAKRVQLETSALRARKNRRAKKIPVVIDVPVRAGRLYVVDPQGKQRKLKASLSDKAPAPKLSLPPGSLIRGTDPTGTYDLFWLIVTAKGRANILGQTFSTGVGWGVSPAAGEVVLFLDLGLELRPKKQVKAKATTPAWGSARAPFWILCHQDIPDLGLLLDSRQFDFPDTLRTAARSTKAKAEPGRAQTMYDVLAAANKSAGKQRELAKKSKGVTVLGVRAGPSTRVVGYPKSNFAGSAIELDAGVLPKQAPLRSINLERTSKAAGVGIRVLTSLSEDFVLGKGKRLESVSRYRTTLICSDPAIETIRVRAWEPDVEIRVDDRTFRIGPEQPATLTPNDLGRVQISMDATDAGAPELLVETNTMDRGTSVIVYPDQELHEKLAGMKSGELQRSGLLGKNVKSADARNVEQALQNISRTVLYAQDESTGGVSSQRRYDPGQMKDAHWALELDAKSGRPKYQKLSARTAKAANAQATGGVRNLDEVAAQGLFKKMKKGTSKVGKVVVSTSKDVGGAAKDAGKAVGKTAKDAGKAVGKTAKDAGKAVGKTAKDAGKAVSKTAKDVGGAAKDAGKAIGGALDDAGSAIASVASDAGDLVVDAAQASLDGLLMTVHFLDKTAVSFVVKTAKQAAAAIGSIIDMVGMAVGKFIEWVRFLFDWKDIKICQRVYANAIRSNLRGAKAGLKSAKKQSNAFFSDLQDKVDALRPKSKSSSSTDLATSPTQNSGQEKTEWFMGLLESGSKGDGNGAKKSQAKSGSLSTGSAVDSFGSATKGFGEFFDALIAGDMDAVKAMATNVALDLASAGIEAVKQFVAGLLSVGIGAIDGIKAALEARIHIPVVTQLYEKFIGGKFNVLNVASLLLAIPVTVVAKLTKGKAPFKAKDSLAQESWYMVTAHIGLGILDFIFAGLGARSVILAAHDFVSPKDYGPLWRLVVVFKCAAILEGILYPIVVSSKAGELVLSFSAVIKNIGQLILHFLPENTRHAELVLEIFFGGVVKLVGSGLEIAEGEATSGLLVGVEGIAALCQIGGFAVGNELAVLGSAALTAGLYGVAGVGRLFVA